MMKALFHIDDSIYWNLLIRNVNNALDYFFKNQMEYKIEIVANSIAVKDLLQETSKYSDELKQLMEKGVTMAACQNSLRSFSIDESSLLEFVTPVPSGVVQLIDRQNNGYAYIKP